MAFNPDRFFRTLDALLSETPTQRAAREAAIAASNKRRLQAFEDDKGARVAKLRADVLGWRIRVRGGNRIVEGVIVDVRPGPTRRTARSITTLLLVTIESGLDLKVRETFTLSRIPAPVSNQRRTS